MWKRVLSGGAGVTQQAWRMVAARRSSNNISPAVDLMLLRSLKEHYLEVTQMNPPPKVSPPKEFSIVKGAMDAQESVPVLTRTYGKEEITISVTRMTDILNGLADFANDQDDINQLFIIVVVSKPGQHDSLHFLCGLYPDAVGIYGVSLRPKVNFADYLKVPKTYIGPVFEELDVKMSDAFYNYIEERGVTEKLFNFLRSWMYVRDHRNLLWWFKNVGTFVNEKTSAKGA